MTKKERKAKKDYKRIKRFYWRWDTNKRKSATKATWKWYKIIMRRAVKQRRKGREARIKAYKELFESIGIRSRELITDDAAAFQKTLVEWHGEEGMKRIDENLWNRELNR